MFREAEMAQNAAKSLGAKIEIPNRYLGRRAYLKEHKDGRLIMEMDHMDDDPTEKMDGWIPEKGKWKRIFQVHASDPHEVDIGKYDDMLRHLVSSDGKDCGWVIRSDGMWRDEPLIHVKSFLEALSFSPKEIKGIIGSSVFKAWTLVNKPFQPEVPGDREWNRNSVQFRFLPSQDRDSLKFPTWMKILNHCGQGLDFAIKENLWAKSNGILTGGDYLKCWIASMFQQPLEPLPYLFFYGPQNSGKSIFHEALNLLVTHGVVRADSALTSSFNGELASAILCVIEETDLRKDLKAANKIKDYITSKEILLHIKNRTPYMLPNSTHWIQCANIHLACPIFPGDTRITMGFVDELSADQTIPKRALIPILEKEAPDFLAEVLNLEIPYSSDRLNVPVIVTDEKLVVEKSNRTMLEIFMEEKCHFTTGKVVKFSELFDIFKQWLDPSDQDFWTKNRVGKELNPRFAKGRLMKRGAQFYIGNVSWHARLPDDPILPRVVCRQDRLFYEGTASEPMVDE